MEKSVRCDNRYLWDVRIVIGEVVSFRPIRYPMIGQYGNFTEQDAFTMRVSIVPNLIGAFYKGKLKRIVIGIDHGSRLGSIGPEVKHQCKKKK